jgi:hypothetical protein
MAIFIGTPFWIEIPFENHRLSFRAQLGIFFAKKWAVQIPRRFAPGNDRNSFL